MDRRLFLWVGVPDFLEIIRWFFRLADNAIRSEAEPRVYFPAEALDGLSRPNVADAGEVIQITAFQLDAIPPTGLAPHDRSAVRACGAALIKEGC